jgi:hypothetical protein
MVIIMRNGKVYRGKLAVNIVTQMKRDHFVSTASVVDYMLLIKQNAAVQYGAHIRIDSASNFLESLRKCGEVKFILGNNL